MYGDVAQEISPDQKTIERYRGAATQCTYTDGSAGAAASHEHADVPFDPLMRHRIDDTGQDIATAERLRNLPIVLARSSRLLSQWLPPETDHALAAVDAMGLGDGEASGASAAMHGHDQAH